MSEDNINEGAVKPEDGKKPPKPRRLGGKTKRGLRRGDYLNWRSDAFNRLR
jgi:hypothetical protein